MPDIEQIAASVDSIRKTFEQHRYICSNQIATAVYLAYHLKKPVLIEGPPGVGKGTQAARLREEFGLAHIATGDLLRDHRERDTELGRQAAERMNAGRLVPER